MKSRILVGMSGGIDSTFAVKRLIERGFAPEGAVLIMHDSSPVAEAERAAESLGIVLHKVDCREAFKNAVEALLVSEYAKGRTPNPCVVCNSEIKFKYLAETARKLGIERISTGHYVRVEYNRDTDRYEMLSASDTKKDQSYFLWRVGQSELEMFENVLDLESKESVKRALLESGIVHESNESQEICFIPDGERVDYIKSRMTPEERESAFCEGNFVNTSGEPIGRHRGLAFYTPGQRKGLGIALGRPAYVLRVVPERNEVVLGFEEDNVCTSFTASDVRFVSEAPFEGEIVCFVRVRHRGALRKAKVAVKDKKCKISLEISEKTVSAGQSAVFYDEKGRVLFGAYID